MAAPAIVIRLEIEERPSVREDALSESESKRLHDWITSRPELRRLVRDAVVLMTEKKAA